MRKGAGAWKPTAKPAADAKNTNPLIGVVRGMKSSPDPARSTSTLCRIASQVRPIMEERGWKVGTLSEFHPTQANLLGININGGREIRLRLRSHRDPTHFLSYESVLGTMLHE